MKRIITTSLMLILSSASANAADIFGGSLKDTPLDVSTSRTWTGPWIGIAGGAIFSNNVLNYDANQTDGESSYHAGFEVDGSGAKGVFGEAQLGYDWQVSSRLLVGLFGGLNISNDEFEASIQSGGYSAKLTMEQEWGGVLGPRVGFVNGNSLFYAAGGWAFGELSKVRATLSNGQQSVGGDVFPDQETDLSGWFGEVGLEHKFDNSMSLKVAGRYTDYGANTLAQGGYQGEGYSASERLELEPSDLKAMIGLVYRP